jgi:hypothetical protein
MNGYIEHAMNKSFLYEKKEKNEKKKKNVWGHILSRF